MSNIFYNTIELSQFTEDKHQNYSKTNGTGW